VNGKMISAETVSGVEGRRIKKNHRGGEFKYDRFDTL
jgi:hypothetical protein